MAGCCGAQRPDVAYEVTFKHDGSKTVVGTIQEARMAVAGSLQGGTYKAVPKPK